MIILFPSIYMSLECDRDFQDEMTIASKHFKTGTFDFDMFISDGILKTSVSLKEEIVLLRSYMMSDVQYEALSNAIERKGGKSLTNVNDYSTMHYANGYMPFVDNYCMATQIVPINTSDIDYGSLRNAIERLNCGIIFIKDYVKSAKMYMPTKFDSNFLYENLETIIPKFIEIRGKNFNKGIVMKESFAYEIVNESRAFICYGNVISHENNLYPNEIDMEQSNEIAYKLARKMKHIPFFTVDFAYLANGDVYVIECGDGQVSGLAVYNDCEKFYQELHNSLK